MKKLLLISVLTLLQFYPNLSFAQKIMDAVKEGNFAKVEKWLNNGDEVNQTFSKENEEGTVEKLHVIEYASFYNQKEILDLFIENKNKFKNFEDWISDALSANIHNCDIETVEKLLDAGASVNNLCDMCRDAPPIAIALSYECYDVYNLLISKGAELVNKDAGYDVIHAAAGIDSLELLKNLVEAEGLDIMKKSNSLEASAVFYAADHGQLDNLLYLVERGAIISDLDKNGWSLFHYASELDIFKYLEQELLENGVFEIKELNKPVPLIITIIQQDNKPLFDYYIANYSDHLKRKDSDGLSALFYLLFIENNTEYFFKELTEHHLKPSWKDKYGKNLKWYAKKAKNKQMLVLIKSFEKTH